MNPEYSIKHIHSKQVWEDFLLSQDLPPFLQSWNSSEQAKAMGEETWKLGIFLNDKLHGIALVHLVKAKRGNYLYLPYGPILQKRNPESLAALTEYLKREGKNEGFHFIRIAPYLERTDEHINLFQQLGYRTAPIHMLSEIVWKLDLTPSEDELLMNMRKTTRNLIRRAIKDGVQVTKTTDAEDVKTFISLMNTTHKRHQFIPYPNELYLSQVEAFKDDHQVLVFTSSFEEKPIASAIIMYYGNAASYHHGASTPSKVPAAYLLQWEAIREAKARGCKEYSFWGIEESEDPAHPFYGITRFKKGFGGDKRYLLMCMDLPIHYRYWGTYLIETIRRMKRGFGLKRS